MAESWLYEAVCRQRPELCVTVGYMKLCVDRDLNCGRQSAIAVLTMHADANRYSMTNNYFLYSVEIHLMMYHGTVRKM